MDFLGRLVGIFCTEFIGFLNASFDELSSQHFARYSFPSSPYVLYFLQGFCKVTLFSVNLPSQRALVTTSPEESPNVPLKAHAYN